MAIIVQEASDADIPRSFEIQAAAYAKHPVYPALFPGPFPSDSTERRIDALIKERKDINDLGNGSTVHYLKAVHEETGDMIAFAKWHIYTTPEAAAAAKKVLNFGPGTNQDACLAFFSGIANRKKELMGSKPHIYLHLLHTDPKYEGRGAGSLLMKWGLQKADELGLPIYLESSPVGHRFYHHHGFKDFDKFSLILSQFGAGSEPHVAPILIREPGIASTGS